MAKWTRSNLEALVLSLDHKTSKIVRSIHLHTSVKNIVVMGCLVFIVCSFLATIFIALRKERGIKLIVQKQKDIERFKGKKIMINPRTKFQYDDEQVYEIEAKKAQHAENNDVFLDDVHATGKAGSITSEYLKISGDGARLTFTGNPVLIIKEDIKQ